MNEGEKPHGYINDQYQGSPGPQITDRQTSLLGLPMQLLTKPRLCITPGIFKRGPPVRVGGMRGPLVPGLLVVIQSGSILASRMLNQDTVLIYIGKIRPLG